MLFESSLPRDSWPQTADEITMQTILVTVRIDFFLCIALDFGHEVPPSE